MSELTNFGKVPPHNAEAEQTVLASALLDHTAVEKIINLLNVEDFYYEANKEIFESIKDVNMQNIPVDALTVTEELKKREKLDYVGGFEYLARLTENIITSKNVEAYCNIIKEKSTLRKLINASNEIIEKGYKENDEVQKIIELAETRIFAISQNRNINSFSEIKDVLLEVFNQLEERAMNKGSLTGITTGYEDLDRMTAGLQRSDLILLAARPSMGKTALALNIAINAVKTGVSVALFSLEMSKEQYVQRIISMESMVESGKLRSGNLDDEDWNRLLSVMSVVSNYKIHVDDTASITLFEMMSKCRRLKIEKGLDLIIVDYLQLMSGGGKNNSNRQQEISDISRGLKAMARELNCPVVALSQLSRAPELRTDHRPIMSDLRESGAIEQDADVVMMLYRDEYYHKEESEKKGITEVIITKQRNGPVGTVELAWIGQYTKFGNIQK
ncbi:replicative DNA helicase [Sedimentibacter acidaminivorans]|jgi:replicative DNA helicase|uniref:Replicative DNA helicase n=1 Tax=Sedimentibacter acidaminivorans TaxID=913099 RepID=A0ABS4GH81_9FIRM|nr:replicative DNA helicase [Sedimentibacter acidaminivorans]MBP1927009.1 replicative DNA helicase [Sedimentibacter acidaminivorans]